MLAANAATRLYKLLTLDTHNYLKSADSDLAYEVKSTQFFTLYNICEFQTLSKNFFIFSIFDLWGQVGAKLTSQLIVSQDLDVKQKKICPKT